MPKFKIKSCKLIGEHLKTDYRITEDDGSEGKRSEDHDRPVHQDLRDSFQELAPHLAILTGCLKPKQAADRDLVKDFHITGFSLKDDEGFVIKGYRSLDNGTVPLNTPFTRYEGENAYTLINQVSETLQKCKTEVLLYITEGKRAPEKQQEIEFPEENVTKLQIAEPEKRFATGLPEADKEAMERVSESEAPAKRGARRVAQSPANPSGIEAGN
jgi:exonuclease VII small subunit